MPKVSSFAPEFFELFKTAHNEKVVLEINDTKKAAVFRFRLHQLRKAMREEGHPLTHIANAVQFSITPEGNLIAMPADNDLLVYLKAAGIGIKDQAFEINLSKEAKEKDLPKTIDIPVKIEENLTTLMDKLMKGKGGKT